MASSWALATWKVQATNFFVKMVILWSDQLPRIALQREAGILVFLYALEVKDKKKCIPRDVYSRFGHERKWNQSIAPMFIVKIPDTIKMKERNSHSTSIMVVELILQYYSLPKLFNCLDRTHENWFLWGIIYIAHFCIGMLKHALYQWQWKKHFQLKKLD